MANMIPGRVDDATPGSERRIFERLRLDPDTADWTVLHSLGLARRGNKPYGEIDFVVLIPGAGILCLEVKGGRVRCEGGEWFTRPAGSGMESRLTRSPIMQAREGMFALRNAIIQHFGAAKPESDVVIGALVIYPDVNAPPHGVEAEKWEIVDRELLGRQSIGQILRSAIRQHRDRLGKSGQPGASAATLRTIRSFLRPDFDRVVARSTSIRRAEERLISLTEEQYDALGSAEANDRVVIEGAAGTGKTLLAVELARRSVQAGRRPIVLCFNRLLGHWFEQELATLGDRVVVGSYHRVLRKLILESSIARDFTRASDEGTLTFADWPAYAVEALGERATLGDILIVDEAQDLSTPDDLAVFDAMLDGGLPGGRWCFFGDFTRQAIFEGSCPEEGLPAYRRMLSERGVHLTVAPLRVNCRNTRQIAQETAMLSGFDEPPFRLNVAEGPGVDYRFWHSVDDQAAALRSVLERLLGDGLTPDEIMILSTRRLAYSAAGKTVLPGIRIVEVTESSESATGEIRFSTIAAFKGLEASVVVLADLEDISERARQSLLYVGMSRARACLVVLLHQNVRPHYESAFRRYLEKA